MFEYFSDFLPHAKPNDASKGFKARDDDFRIKGLGGAAFAD
jgi:hypothetical protein